MKSRTLLMSATLLLLSCGTVHVAPAPGTAEATGNGQTAGDVLSTNYTETMRSFIREAADATN